MEPRLTIVRGDPTPEEIAALVTVLTARLTVRRATPEPVRLPVTAGHPGPA